MIWDGLRLAVSLLSVFPSWGRTGSKVSRNTAAAAMAWAPAVGLGLGAIAAAVLVGADRLLRTGPLLAAVLAIASLALLTRGLHLDGLADLADGLGSGKPAPQALEVMRRPDIGPFGVATLVLTLLAQVAALAQAQSRGAAGAVGSVGGVGNTAAAGHGAAAVVAATVAGRLAITWACRRGVPAARPKGLGALVAGTLPATVPAVITAAVAGLAALCGWLLDVPWDGWLLPVGIVAGLAASFVLAGHAVRRLGGITGDVLGALSEIAATVCLVVIAA
ncbi:MAG TPA: adenosylcobinamide-GDP ribazoletransferase [Streptosporangiaceae bacterium]|nr:adenosylcobinamide-GDP ribazoletransferase [Streptosporangiaceae bacterium]